MPIKFIPQSDDPYLKKDADMSLAKFGHINFLLHQINNNEHATNAAAKIAGLEDGDFYHTAGIVKVVIP